MAWLRDNNTHLNKPKKDKSKCECNYQHGMGPNLKCPVHGKETKRQLGIK